jgi:predicted glycoside hydrolase/deacetylase ChbG (UPF0249 family)
MFTIPPRYNAISLLALLGTALCAAIASCSEPTYAELLGWPPGSKVVIFHIDDAGMSHDSNMGAIEAVERGVATSMSVMFPCSWSSEMAHYLQKHSAVDAGVHITLTSEWKNYRWGPLVGAKQAPGLVDSDGCLWDNVLKVAAMAKPDEVEMEIRAQLDRCRRMGIQPTHLDTHMGTVFANPAFLEKYVQIGIESGIPVMLPAGHMSCLLANAPITAVPLHTVANHYGKRLWDAGLPVLDDLHTGTLHDKPEKKQAQIIDFLRTVKPGVTQFIVHCTKTSESFAAISGSGPMRLAELNAMVSPEVKKVVDEEKIILTTWRELKQRRGKVKPN